MDLVGGVLEWTKTHKNWTHFDHRRRHNQCTKTPTVTLQETRKHTNSSNMVPNYCKISPIISIFVFFLFLFSSVCPVLSSESDNHNRVNQTFQPNKELQNLKMIRAHLKKINRPSLKTIQSPDGDLIDCVESHLQPSFDHPQLKGQKPLDPPERPKDHNPTETASENFQLWSLSGESCPEGTIPIRRTTEQDILRARSIQSFGKKIRIRRFGRRIRRPIRRDSSSNGHEGLLEAREELRPLLLKSNDRLKDLLFLDIALDSTVRTAVERGYEELNNAKPEKVMFFITLLLENLALSSDDNEDLIYCLKGWNQALSMIKNGDSHWALYAKSVLDRTRLALTSKAEWYQHLLQPSAEYLGSRLGVDQWAVNIFTEEIIRAGSAASLSSLINRLDPILRETANLGSWQVISPVEAIGYVVVVDELLTVQNKSYGRPTILVAKSVKGEEDIPDGAVAVLTPDMPDVLSHVSVRARNSKVCFATCFDPNILADLQANEGKLLQIKPTSVDIVYSKVEGGLTSASSTNLNEEGPLPSIKLVRKQFGGRYAISSEEFTSEVVGAKSRNIGYLKGKVPSWVGIPTSVALPFGVFEKVLSDGLNQKVAEKLQLLKKKLGEGDVSALKELRKTVLELSAPSQLVQELKDKMKSSGMPWPGDEGQQRWEQAWTAIKKVWASKWNERAYFSTRKVKLDHDYLCMAVLVQEIINADYAFVIHTTNPSSGDSSEIYAEMVKGLGETLVGAYPGRALSFVCKKNNLNSPQVLGYPSKPIGLFIRRSIIFRSDSNGEDLEGYAGAGLYDSVPMDEEEKIVLDYSSDPLIIDANFRQSILSSIARAGNAIEELYGSPQDIEGVVKDRKIYVVQTRPQM